ncbi:MAG: hypothetical protein CMF22_10395 [Idiomarinaceae bacterium]|nr:hypothetical protein [Idiomarinaceae bacterium]MBG23850.1 hypothetical protein [Idiomarinaceae bacterium]|tara:strand:+ start:20669 stop:21052 length:384 start_codon:yes stop_codon:yes gene_type:complete
MTTFNAEFHPQHAPSNSLDSHGRKAMSDHFLADNSTYYNPRLNNEEIERKKGGGFIVVMDAEVTEIREATNNSMARGDAIEVVLYKKMRNYPGLIDHNDEGDIKAKSGISTALYCEEEAATYYFLEG